MRFAKAVVKHRILILILTVALLVPSAFGMAATRVNYDMLTYLPENMDTVVGQNELLEDFNKGAFTFLIFEDMPNKDVAALKQQVEQVDHVDTVLWYDSLADLSIPMEMLPDKVYQAFNSDHSTMMAVFFDSGTSEDTTTLAMPTLLACDSSLSNEAAYQFVKGIYENLDVISTSHAMAAKINLDHAANINLEIHPGALQYYREMGIVD